MQGKLEEKSMRSEERVPFEPEASAKSSSNSSLTLQARKTRYGNKKAKPIIVPVCPTKPVTLKRSRGTRKGA